MIMRSGQSGNAVVFLLLAIALFAALAYSFMRGSQTGTGNFEKQQGSLNSSEYKACLNAVEMADVRLQQRGCAGLVSRSPDGSNSKPGAPTDGSCSIFHANGGKLTPCVQPECSASRLNALAIGASCEGLIYAGTSGGNRIYTMSTDVGNYTWSSGTFASNTGATSNTDGLANTNILVNLANATAPYNAAVACRSLGPKWYLPARDELLALSSNSGTGELAGTIGQWTRYWSSTDWPTSQALALENNAANAYGKSSSYAVRCVRRN